jgi:hypothetical protein
MLTDLAHAARLLLQNKGWTPVVVLSLAQRMTMRGRS